MKRSASFLISFLMLLSPAASQAVAQTNAVAPGSVAISPTPVQAQQLLGVLQDQTKRQQLIQTLQVIATSHPAQGAAGAATLSTTGTLAPGTVLPKNPIELLLSDISAQMSSALHEITSTTVLVTRFPVLWHWLMAKLGDTDIRMKLVLFLGQLLVLSVCALGAEWGIWWLMRRPYRALAGPLTPDAERHHQDTKVAEARPHAGPLYLLHRLPFVIAGLIVDLLPVAIFALIANLAVAFILGTDRPSDRAMLAILNAYVLVRAAMCLLRMLIAPIGGRLRLLTIKDATALYAQTWFRRMMIVAVFGATAAHIAALFGLPSTAEDAMFKVVALIVHLFLVVVVLQCRHSVTRVLQAKPEARGSIAVIRNILAAYWHYIAIFYIIAFWLIWAIEIKDGIYRLLYGFFGSFGVLLAARIVSIVVLGGIEQVVHGETAWAKRIPGLDTHARRYYGLMRSTVWSLIVLVTSVALLEVWGIDVLVWFWTGHFGNRVVSATVTIAVAVAIAIAVWEVTNAAMDRHLAHLTQRAQLARSVRLRTLLPIIRTGLMVTLLIIVAMTVLDEIGVNIAPLLAGAGIVGVAIGFGSQKLVQDLITGLFLLIENAMQVGDWVTVAGLSGSVENLSIRTIRLRAGDGSVHIIPFSSVTSVTNTNRGIGNAAVSVNIAIDQDVDRVCEILKQIAIDMRQDPDFNDLMLSDLQLWGVDKVDAAAVTIVGQIVCTDSGRWGVQREYNRRLKMRFEAEGIVIANPTQTVVLMQPREPGYAEKHHLDGKDMDAALDPGATPASKIISPPPTALSNQH